MKTIKVTWRDSHRYSYQMSTDENIEIAVIHTVGFLVRKTSTDIVIAQDYIMGDIRGVVAIPRENIISFKRLK